MKIIALAALFVLYSSSLFADDSEFKTPIDKYRSQNDYFLIMCKIDFKLNQNLIELGKEIKPDEDFGNCIKESKIKSQKDLGKALNFIKIASAKQALKKYHISFVAALYGIRPSIDELKIVYDQRQDRLQEKMTEAWAAFEIE